MPIPSPLKHLAINELLPPGKDNMVTLLCDNGGNVEARTRDGLTPLHCAARSGHERVVEALLERGSPITSKSKVRFIRKFCHWFRAFVHSISYTYR